MNVIYILIVVFVANGEEIKDWKVNQKFTADLSLCTQENIKLKTECLLKQCMSEGNKLIQVRIDAATPKEKRDTTAVTICRRDGEVIE